MAKSVRASVSKRNSANLRSKVFGPVDAARTARLSAKLQELASQPKPDAGKSNENEDQMKTDDVKSTEPEKSESSEGMDIDKKTGSSTKNRSNKSGRIQKRHRKHSIVFDSNSSKGKKGSKRLK